jgi:hypothetical protein
MNKEGRSVATSGLLTSPQVTILAYPGVHQQNQMPATGASCRTKLTSSTLDHHLHELISIQAYVTPSAAHAPGRIVHIRDVSKSAPVSDKCVSML